MLHLRSLSILSVAALSSLLQGVYGHGYVEEITLGNTKHTGYLPYNDPYTNPPPPRIVRKLPGNGPVEDLTLMDMECNGYEGGDPGQAGSAPAPLVGTIAAGDTVKFKWTQWPDSHAGPIITYLARAPSDITKWEPKGSAVWFKIDQTGKGADHKWAATDGLYANNHTYTLRIPPKLKPGQYLMRHEIIALHSAWAYPGAQIYPSCTQLEVTGSGNALPTSGLVAFPGAYTKDTPGILFNMWSDVETTTYPIPGPEVWTGGN
ncbi:glycoside hydrolase [Coprinopsis sp. MPI-PUGE-AT-0042]|nr:glycoside hydrolase [Coprinopsis sp. MPI-PUGE-AT-0042]